VPARGERLGDPDERRCLTARAEGCCRLGAAGADAHCAADPGLRWRWMSQPV